MASPLMHRIAGCDLQDPWSVEGVTVWSGSAPRLSNLRAYGSDRVGVIKTRNDGEDSADDVSPFFETISGRLTMMVFAVTVTKELMTGSSVFGKMDIEGLTSEFISVIGLIASS
ncbi:hypothetical protein K1719_027434 [Acacia pycnantha]|nr:hypothetical protein K1719_027434 [Acacia pycnantha]